MRILPEGILEASFRRSESGGIELYETHPRHEAVEEEIKKAYEIMGKLSQEERDIVENSWGLELGLHFDVGYAAGLVDGVATGGAVGGGIKEFDAKAVVSRIRSKHEQFAGGPAKLDRTAFLGGACGAIRALAESGIMNAVDVDLLEGCLMEYLFECANSNKTPSERTVRSIVKELTPSTASETWRPGLGRER